jgi:hypothetical protein
LAQIAPFDLQGSPGEWCTRLPSEDCVLAVSMTDTRAMDTWTVKRQIHTYTRIQNRNECVQTIIQRQKHRLTPIHTRTHTRTYIHMHTQTCHVKHTHSLSHT